MARKKVEQKMTAKAAIAALDKAHAELVKSTVAAQRAVIEIGRVWHLTCKVNKRKSPARDKVMNHGVELFGKNAPTYMSNAARLYQIVTGQDKDIPFTVEQADEVLESTASVNPTSLVKVLRDWYKDAQATTEDKTDDKTDAKEDKTEDKTEDTGTDVEPVTVDRTVNAEYSTLTTDEFTGTVTRCLNDAIRRLNDGWTPSADDLAVMKKQIATIGEKLSDIKPADNPLDTFVKKVATA